MEILVRIEFATFTATLILGSRLFSGFHKANFKLSHKGFSEWQRSENDLVTLSDLFQNRLYAPGLKIQYKYAHTRQNVNGTRNAKTHFSRFVKFVTKT